MRSPLLSQFLLTSLYLFSVFFRSLVLSLCPGVINTVAAARLPVLTVPVGAARLPLSVPLAQSAQATWKLLLRWPLTFLWRWSFLVWRLSMLSLIHPCSCTQMTILWRHCRDRFPQLWGRHPQWGNMSLFEPWASWLNTWAVSTLTVSSNIESYVNTSKEKKTTYCKHRGLVIKLIYVDKRTDRKKMEPHKNQIDVFGKLQRAL